MQQPRSVPELLDDLATFATAVEASLSGEGIEWLRRPSRSEWSLTEVICHLRDVEREVHQARFHKLLAAENIFLSGATPDEWVKERRYQQQHGPTALSDFLAARRQTLALLQTIEDDAIWSRRGRHAFFGSTSMHELLNLAVKHDQVHWEQIRALLKEIP